MAVSLLSGVVILARPESLFQSDQLDTNYDLVGLMSALAVPCLSALIVIITRQVSPNHLVTCHSSLLLQTGQTRPLLRPGLLVWCRGSHSQSHWDVCY